MRSFMAERLGTGLEKLLEIGNINDKWLFLKSLILEATSNFVPMNSWKKKDSWEFPMQIEIRKLLNRKHRLWTRYQETRNKKVLNEYKHIRNVVRKESRKIKQKIQNDIAVSCKSNPKKFWLFINSKTKSKSHLVGNIVQKNWTVVV